MATNTWKTSWTTWACQPTRRSASAGSLPLLHSPECVEGGFYELRLEGVLRSSGCASLASAVLAGRRPPRRGALAPRRSPARPGGLRPAAGPRAPAPARAGALAGRDERRPVRGAFGRRRNLERLRRLA